MATHYSQEFKEQAIAKTLQRGDKSIQTIADELNVNQATLRTWLKNAGTTMNETPTDKRPADWTRAQRLQALMQSAALEGEELNAFCREQGIFSHHLDDWKTEFSKESSKASTQRKASADKALRDENKQLKKELDRKEKALAEAAALLVLSKKCQAFWEERA